MKFLYKSKHGEDYIGTVARVLTIWENQQPKWDIFESDKGVSYRSDQVEWLDEIRDRKLSEIGI